MPRRDVLLGLGLGGMVVLGACGGRSGGVTQGGRFAGDVSVDHLQSAIVSAPFLIAAELGYFTAAGLDVEMVSFPGGTGTIRSIASGSPFGMPATLTGLTGFQKGGDRTLRLVSGAYNSASANFIVPTGSPIQGIPDLAGKRIAVSQPGSLTTYFATRIVTEQGLVPGRDATILHVGSPPEAWTAAKQGVADVAWSTPPLSDALVASGEARVLFETRDHVAHWCDTTYWSRTDFMEQSPDVLRSMLRVMQRTFTTIRDDPDTAAPAYARRAQLDPAVARTALAKAAPALSLEIQRPALEENVRAGVELGQLDPSLDLDEVVVADFVNSL